VSINAKTDMGVKSKWMIALLLWVVLMMAVSFVSYRQAVKDLRQEAQSSLASIDSKLNAQLNKYQSLPKVVSKHNLVIDTLLSESNIAKDSRTQKLNVLLESYNNDTDSEAIYLLDNHGTAIASSNWQQEDSFVGVDYRFRPYFQQSIKGLELGYFALGTVSGIRGYYFSTPVYYKESVVGVLVVKIPLDAIEENLVDRSFDFVVTDVYGAVFFSSRSQWNYHSISMLPDDIKKSLIDQRQYGENKLSPLTTDTNFSKVLTKGVITLKESSDEYLIFSREIKHIGWQLIAMVPHFSVINAIVKTLLVFSLFYILLVLLYASWNRMVLARKDLAKNNALLELRVDERTKALQITNTQLRDIIEKYKETEITLKQTEQELIQAAKLAMLGEMSAGINHELNQPLTAMRIYIQNMKIILKKGDKQKVYSVLDHLLKLNDMLEKIVGQYKVFARKAKGVLGPVSLAEVVDASVNILENKLSKSPIKLEIQPISADLKVVGDVVPLEQVVINLLNNAIQAVAEMDNASIKIALGLFDDSVKLTVSDNGKGISEENLDQLFEPFFTTKNTGIGLGLTISKRIMDAFGGSIIALDKTQQGASFVITLKRYY